MPYPYIQIIGVELQGEEGNCAQFYILKVGKKKINEGKMRHKEKKIK